MKRRLDPLLVAALLLYLLLALPALSYYPRITVDESFFSNPGYTLVTQGYLGTPIMDGFHDIAQRTYWMPPVDLVLKAAVFKLFGFTHLYIRLTTVALGLIALLLTYALGRVLFGAQSRVPGLAALLLSAETLFLMNARAGRVEATETVFVLLALLAAAHASRRSDPRAYLLAGAGAVLAALSHPLGAFVCAAVFVLCLLDLFAADDRPPWWRRILWLGLGAGLAALPYLIYVAQDPREALVQLRDNGAGSNLLRNILDEPRRYLKWLFALNTLPLPLQVISLELVLGPVIALLWTARKRAEPALRFLAISLLCFLVFLAIQRNTIVIYLAVGMPLMMLSVAAMLERVARRQRRLHLGRLALPGLTGIVVLLLLGCNIASNLGGWWLNRETNVETVLSEVRAAVGPDERILGDATWWVGLPDTPFVDFRARKDLLDDACAFLTVEDQPATLMLMTPLLGEWIKDSRGQRLTALMEQWTTLEQTIPFKTEDRIEVRRVDPAVCAG